VSSVVVGRPGKQLVARSDICVKSGVPTVDRVVLRGSTTPGWVVVLLFLTVIGWVIALVMTSRRYEVDVPFRHDLYVRWLRTHVLSWLIGLGGVAGAVTAGQLGFGEAWILLGVTLVGILLGIGNSWATTAGVVQRGDDLVLTRVHPAFVRSLARAAA
jgi:hypothetical protein